MGLPMMKKSHLMLLVVTRKSFMIAMAFEVKIGEQGLNMVGI